MIKQPAVGAGLGVVELVDDDDVVCGGRDVADARGGQRLNACEDMLPPFRTRATDIQLREVGVVQHLAVGPQGLLQNLPAVRNEKQ